MRRLACLFALLLCSAPANAAVLFEGTFSGVVDERYFGDIQAYDTYGDAIPDFSGDSLTSAELGLPGFIDPGDRFDGRIALVQDDLSGEYFLYCWLPFSYCGQLYEFDSLDRDPLTNRITGFAVSTAPQVWGGSYVSIWDGGGHYYYEDDASYGGVFPGGGHWRSDWGLRVNMTFGPITRTDIAAVPLPASALLLAGGVGLLGAAARRGRRTSSLAG